MESGTIMLLTLAIGQQTKYTMLASVIIWPTNKVPQCVNVIYERLLILALIWWPHYPVSLIWLSFSALKLKFTLRLESIRPFADFSYKFEIFD